MHKMNFILTCAFNPAHSQIHVANKYRSDDFLNNLDKSIYILQL